MKYDNENFVHGTIGECDFIEKEIEYNKATRILDIGCGTGRHSIELAARGYAVVGTDLSESFLKRAKEKASERKLQIVFQKKEARNLPFFHEFNLVIMICESAFPLMETDEMNYQILQNAGNALLPKGKLIFTTVTVCFLYFTPSKISLIQKQKKGMRNVIVFHLI